MIRFRNLPECFKKEVAQRICEKKGLKRMEFISFSTGFYDAEYLYGR
jgi:hypothetical protein